MTSPVVGSTIFTSKWGSLLSSLLPEASSVKPEIVAVELVIIPDSSGFRALFMVNTGADSPSFFMVKVSSMLEPKLAFVSVALSVVPKVRMIFSSNSYILSLFIVISKETNVFDSRAFDAGMTTNPSAATVLELLSPVIEKFGSELLAIQKSYG